MTAGGHDLILIVVGKAEAYRLLSNTIPISWTVLQLLWRILLVVNHNIAVMIPPILLGNYIVMHSTSCCSTRAVVTAGRKLVIKNRVCPDGQLAASFLGFCFVRDAVVHWSPCKMIDSYGKRLVRYGYSGWYCKSTNCTPTSTTTRYSSICWMLEPFLAGCCTQLKNGRLTWLSPVSAEKRTILEVDVAKGIQFHWSSCLGRSSCYWNVSSGTKKLYIYSGMF